MRYKHAFKDGSGGWYTWQHHGGQALDIENGAAVMRSPWWVDFNHAPPGAGYLHILYALNTASQDNIRDVAGENSFLQGGFPRDFTNARITVRVRGSLAAKGAQMVLLAQGDVTEPIKTRVNSVLTAQPIEITPDWSTQTITLAPDNNQWTCLGSRADRFQTYGWGPIAPLLRDINLDILFVLFPLDVQPAQPLEGDMHIPRAGADYPVDVSRLPEGEIMLESIAIDFAT